MKISKFHKLRAFLWTNVLIAEILAEDICFSDRNSGGNSYAESIVHTNGFVTICQSELILVGKADGTRNLQELRILTEFLAKK